MSLPCGTYPLIAQINRFLLFFLTCANVHLSQHEMPILASLNQTFGYYTFWKSKNRSCQYSRVIPKFYVHQCNFDNEIWLLSCNFSILLVARVLIMFVIFVAPNICNKFIELKYNYVEEKVVASVRKCVELLSQLSPQTPTFIDIEMQF